jgi:hypothetical protein
MLDETPITGRDIRDRTSRAFEQFNRRLLVGWKRRSSVHGSGRCVESSAALTHARQRTEATIRTTTTTRANVGLFCLIECVM